MAANQQNHGKVGSDPDAAKSVGGKGDFGVDVNDTVGRDYTSHNTKASDPNAAMPHAGENDERTAGVGGKGGAVGSSSGGDLDTDIIGVGTGGSGIAQSGRVGRPPGPDDSDGSSDEFASGGHAQGFKGKNAGKIVGGDTVDHSGEDRHSNPVGGADSVTNNPAAPRDDSFVGEISMGEASGQDSV